MIIDKSGTSFSNSSDPWFDYYLFDSEWLTEFLRKIVKVGPPDLRTDRLNENSARNYLNERTEPCNVESHGSRTEALSKAARKEEEDIEVMPSF